MLTRSAFDALLATMSVPAIVAPMTGVSSLELTDAVTRAGAAGAFPVHVCGSTEEVRDWLKQLDARDQPCGPVLPNLIVHRTNARRDADLLAVCEATPPAVITSVGSPAAVVPALHEAGIAVFADVASVRHARRAIEAGADGLVLLAAGAGGQTGWANPFAFIRAVRQFWDGPTVLAGGLSDGTSLLAARVAGYDLGYFGTPFIATHESAASDAYRAAAVAATLDDIELTTEFTGIGTSMIRTPDISTGTSTRGPVEGEYDSSRVTESGARAAGAPGPAVFSAGHSVSGIDRVLPAAELVARIVEEYHTARADMGRGLGTPPWNN